MIEPHRFGDHRGFFAETYSQRVYAELGIDENFVQDTNLQLVETICGILDRLHPRAGGASSAKAVARTGKRSPHWRVGPRSTWMKPERG